jgi:hypothetical protein
MEQSVIGFYNLLEERAILATTIIASTFKTSAHIGICSTVLIKCRVFVLIIKLITTNSAVQYYLEMLKSRIEGCGLDSSGLG